MTSTTEYLAFASMSVGTVVAASAAFGISLVWARWLGFVAEKPRRARQGAIYGCLAALVPATFIALLVGGSWASGMFGTNTSSLLGLVIGIATWQFVPIVALGVIASMLMVVLPSGGAK